MESVCDETDSHNKCDHGTPRRGGTDIVIHSSDHLNVQSQWHRKLYVSDFCDVYSVQSEITRQLHTIVHARVTSLCSIRI